MTRALLAISMMVFGFTSLNASAQAPSAPAAAPAPAPSAAPAVVPPPTDAAPAVAKKGGGKYAAAKEECLKDNAGLKGKELRKCIKEKKSK
jgi:hypothetical protein